MMDRDKRHPEKKNYLNSLKNEEKLVKQEIEELKKNQNGLDQNLQIVRNFF